MTQSTVFRDGEGDAWFERNRAALCAPRGPDWVEFLIERLAGRERIASMCDLGCANGWRLTRIAPLLSSAVRLAGVDASAAAIADGRTRYPGLELVDGLIDDPPFPEATTFDLVTINFVLHWIDRVDLGRAVAAIDRLVARNGFLVISDFLPDRPVKRAYHHLPGQGVWTYKQDYSQTFVALGLYRELARVTFPHGTLPAAAERLLLEPVGSAERCGAMLLQKTDEGYMVT